MKPTSWQECTFAWNCWRLFGWRKKRGVLRWWCFGGKGHGPRVGSVVDEWKVQNLKRHGLRMQIANALIKRSLFHTFVEFLVPWCDMMTRSARWCLTCYVYKLLHVTDAKSWSHMSIWNVTSTRDQIMQPRYEYQDTYTNASWLQARYTCLFSRQLCWGCML